MLFGLLVGAISLVILHALYYFNFNKNFKYCWNSLVFQKKINGNIYLANYNKSIWWCAPSFSYQWKNGCGIVITNKCEDFNRCLKIEECNCKFNDTSLVKGFFEDFYCNYLQWFV